MANATVRQRQWLTSLIHSLPSEGVDASHVANPLRDFAPEGKNILLTLYALFEKELLPALDLLDRNLVSRLQVQSHETQAEKTRPYMVRSAQQHYGTHRGHNREHVNYYEVRLQAWSCSCPAFVFSAFPASAPQSDEKENDDQTEESDVLVGGLTRGDDVPICKHLLACLLVQHCGAFSQFVEEKEVSMEELAGSAAGWYD